MASRMIKITSLWRYESEKSTGGEYFGTRVGDVFLSLFHNPSSHPKAPAFDLCVSPVKDRIPKPKPPTYAAKHSEEEPEEEWGGEEEAYPVEGEEPENQETPEVEDEDDTTVPF